MRIGIKDIKPHIIDDTKRAEYPEWMAVVFLEIKDKHDKALAKARAEEKLIIKK